MRFVESSTPCPFDSLQRAASAADTVDSMDEASRPRTTPEPTIQRARLLDEMLDELACRGAGREVHDIAIAHGRRVELASATHGSSLHVRRPDGSVEITIEIGPTGPLVRVAAAALEVTCGGSVAIDCGSFEVRADHRIDLACEQGDVRLDAGDDVVVTGERIRLN